jgi:cell division protein FtsL
MKKFFIITVIIFLILFTAIIKNSTKRIDDKIFTMKENIRGLKKDFENVKLEYDYLSSAEKLLEFQALYFEDELIIKDIKNIKTIDKSMNDLKIEKFKFTNEK